MGSREISFRVELTTSGYSAYSEDIPGCVATGTSKREAMRNMLQAIKRHVRHRWQKVTVVELVNDEDASDVLVVKALWAPTALDKVSPLA